MAVGGHQNDGGGSNAGHVRVFENNNGSWNQLGSDIDGEGSGDRFGGSVVLSSDGNRLAAEALKVDMLRSMNTQMDRGRN